MNELVIHLPEGKPVESDPDFERRAELLYARGLEPMVYRKPKVIGSIANRELFSGGIILDEGLKGSIKTLSFSEELDARTVIYEIPETLELAALKEVITIIAFHEHGNYPAETRIQPTGAELTIDQAVVPPGESQRGDRIHWDGTSGWEHIYLVSSNNPTQFYWTNGPKAIGLEGMGVNGHIDPTGLDGPYVPEDYEIVMANSTTPHASPIMPNGGSRTFLRLAYEHFVPQTAGN